MEKFYLDQYLPKAYSANTSQVAVKDEFSKLCKIINGKFMSEWQQETETTSETLRLQKKAILGYEQEVFYFKNKIRDAIKEMGSGHVAFPSWYESLEDGIYQENWGMAGMAEWFYPQYANSSSAKIIGKKLFFMEDGVMVKKTQTIEDARREQLVRAILLLTPEERLDREFHEVYMLDGTRITIFGGMMTKEGEDVIIFRRYIIPTYSFEEQVARGTIPEEAIPLFKNMIELGYNCAFTGAVRSAKTTFLSTWQSYENQNLEGVMVETDPEIPLHRLMPDAPIIQIIADNEKLKHISKNLLRSDADYFILAEAREGIALDTAVKIANKGTRRMKITFHTRDPSMFSYDVAGEIVKSLGGEMNYTAQRVASSFDYVFHFIQLKNKNQKRMKSIYQMYYDQVSQKIKMDLICKYSYEQDNWQWFYHMAQEKENFGIEENPTVFHAFQKKLLDLSKERSEKT
ncbi:MAG: hypothetical protein RR131_07900 [Anaerovorax sp.]